MDHRAAKNQTLLSTQTHTHSEESAALSFCVTCDPTTLLSYPQNYPIAL